MSPPGRRKRPNSVSRRGAPPGCAGGDPAARREGGAFETGPLFRVGTAIGHSSTTARRFHAYVTPVRTAASHAQAITPVETPHRS